MNRDAVFFHPHERKKIGRKYPPLLFPMFPFPLTEWKPVRGRIDVRFPRRWTTNQSRLPLSQIRYVILDLVADPVPSLHHRIFATIARWHSHARVHFHPEAFTHRRCKGSACATSFPPSALHQKGPVFFVLRIMKRCARKRGGTRWFYTRLFFFLLPFSPTSDRSMRGVPRLCVLPTLAKSIDR